LEAWIDAQCVSPFHEGAAIRNRAGVHIHAGSDDLNPFVVPGISLHEELRLFVGAGLTPEEAWVTATRWPGEALAFMTWGVATTDKKGEVEG
jgi:imidazolonepropionase-like amidohydrolase